MGSDRIETTATTVWIDDGVAHIRAKGVMSTPETVAETYEVLRGLLADGPMPVLFDARLWPGPERQAWASLIKDMSSVFTAGALLIEPELEADLGTYPEMVHRLLMPFGVFTEESEALDFVRAYRAE